MIQTLPQFFALPFKNICKQTCKKNNFAKNEMQTKIAKQNALYGLKGLLHSKIAIN